MGDAIDEHANPLWAQYGVLALVIRRPECVGLGRFDTEHT